MTDKKKIKPSLRNLASGDVLFREGEVGDFAYQVVKGKIEVGHNEDAAHEGQDLRLPHHLHRRDRGHPQDRAIDRVDEEEGEHDRRRGEAG